MADYLRPGMFAYVWHLGDSDSGVVGRLVLGVACMQQA